MRASETGDARHPPIFAIISPWLLLLLLLLLLMMMMQLLAHARMTFAVRVGDARKCCRLLVVRSHVRSTCRLVAGFNTGVHELVLCRAYGRSV